ncbi:MAG: TRAP transporter small permease [Arenicella sp.]
MIKRWFDKCEEIIIGGLLVLIAFMVFFEVFCRFFLTSEWLTLKALETPGGLLQNVVDFGRWVQIWIQELTLYLSGWMVLLGASWAVKEKSHICMDALTTRVSEKTERIMTLIGLALSLIYCGFFIYGSWIFLGKLKKIGIEMNDIPLQKWIAESVLIIGFVLLVVRLLQLAYRVIIGEDNGFYKHANVGMDEIHGADGLEQSNDNNAEVK